MSAVVLKSNQPIQFGSGGSSSVTLKFSSQPIAASSGATLYRKPGYNYPVDIIMGDGPGRRLRKNVANVRRHVDYVSNILNHYESRLWQYGKKQRTFQQPDELYQNTALPAWCTPDVPVDCILTKFVRAAMNKVKCPWTPEGKRLITGASTGEFTLWNGTAFNFETILQAHDSAIRAMTWSHNEQWLISGDHDGYIKYWQPNMNNVHMYQAHKDDPIRGLSFAPTDVKLVSASDDGTARIWDFARCTEEKVLRGHGSEVRCVDWHPTKGLVVTGSRDSQQPVKLWDPKSGQCLSTLQDHKSSVMAVQWNSNGNWLLTGGRDHLIKLYDIRIMKEMHTFRGHKKEVTSVAWNPVHENLFVSGGGDGSIAYWLVGLEKEVGLLEHAHDQAIWAMQFHPKGSNDNNTKFWARNRPGDTQEDIFGLASFTTNMVGALDKEREPKASHIRIDEETILASSAIPGMGLDEDVLENMNRDVTNNPASNANAMLLMPEDLNSRRDVVGNSNRKVLLKQPPPKKAQRQFERMWNISKPGASGEDGSNQGEDVYRQPKASLLGAPPGSMLANQPVPNSLPPPMNLLPPVGPSALLNNRPPGHVAPWSNSHQQLSREAFIQDVPPRAERLGPAFESFQHPPPNVGSISAPWGPNGAVRIPNDRREDRGIDVDYRSVAPGGDIDLRSGGLTDSLPFGTGMHQEMRSLQHLGPPPPLSHIMALNVGPMNILPPPMVMQQQSDNWRIAHSQEQGSSNASAEESRMNDPRLRRQDEIRDPRRRQQTQNEPPRRPPSRQDNRNDSWMPTLNMTDGYGRDDNYRRNDYQQEGGYGGNGSNDRYGDRQEFNRGGGHNDRQRGLPKRGRGRGRPY